MHIAQKTCTYPLAQPFCSILSNAEMEVKW